MPRKSHAGNDYGAIWRFNHASILVDAFEQAGRSGRRFHAPAPQETQKKTSSPRQACGKGRMAKDNRFGPLLASPRFGIAALGVVVVLSWLAVEI